MSKDVKRSFRLLKRAELVGVQFEINVLVLSRLSTYCGRY